MGCDLDRADRVSAVKRLITAHELHLFFAPSRDEVRWASEATDDDGHLLALLLMLKSYQRMGCFPKLEDVPEMVADFVRRQVGLPEGTLAVYRAGKTAKNHRAWSGSGAGCGTTRRRPAGSRKGRSGGRQACGTVRRI
ncbi:DUF4158 domain-containing protein [Streptomyces clavuligerus]|uniref:Transposase Tn3 protein n=1 Tax=Streptomyces clavuligerus TaxID=1901 RepID=B5H2V3_STRCL|nr:DUF4158 domain-containing protein [Streptomyces clavuligerus]EDY52899.1 hypothetical protein SSCG_05952 [Streptomyces clavuligerus]EFG03630.1 Transposase Tn3 protein [Streptomyces clavuligerus]MBY6307807.1 DUF4158 domain-containing protein [Streptomyces clavuligerus]QCS09643.1 DUF4158 domain-containing protein [Streptomyces clavuligerus]QPJ98313.1 DUF4158 domain-containing protein [Streptomyces clavuligerus]